MNRLSFILQSALNPRAVGAIMPSSKYLAQTMLENVDFQQAQYIVEYGPGTGVFTDRLLARRNEQTVVLLVETNEEFCRLLQAKYSKEKNVHVIHGSAALTAHYLKERQIPFADYVISSLPFASLPLRVSSEILEKTRDILGDNGKFITFQYTQSKKGLIAQYFSSIKVRREYKNIPPAYVLICSNKSDRI